MIDKNICAEIAVAAAVLGVDIMKVGPGTGNLSYIYAFLNFSIGSFFISSEVKLISSRIKKITYVYERTEERLRRAVVGAS